MIPVHGFVKNYHWGKVGKDSYIAKFEPSHAEPNQPLAELWFGSHPSGPCTVIVGKQSFKMDAFLSKHVELIGTMEFFEKSGNQLPYLFKILSIEQPLSLQAHPDRKLARELNSRDPKNYPDPNHKPELAIALTEFEVLCDFRPIKEIVDFMTLLPNSLQKLIGEQNYELLFKSDDTKKALANSFSALMLSSSDSIKEAARNLFSSSSKIDKQLLEVVARLDKLYPGDPGVFAPFFLNYLKLSPGQSIYLKANKLHAYIKGECIECMACSDNVVRAGLTNKYRDVNTLLRMLDYDCVTSSSQLLLEGVNNLDDNKATTTFAPTREFRVDRILIDKKTAPHNHFELRSLTSGSFIVVLSGSAKVNDFHQGFTEHLLTLGSAGFVPPKVLLRLRDIRGPMLLYRAYC